MVPAARCTAAIARGLSLSDSACRLQAARVARSAHARALSIRELAVELLPERTSRRRPRSSARPPTTSSCSEFSESVWQASTRRPAARVPASAGVRLRASIARDSIRRLARAGLCGGSVRSRTQKRRRRGARRRWCRVRIEGLVLDGLQGAAEAACLAALSAWSATSSARDWSPAKFWSLPASNVSDTLHARRVPHRTHYTGRQEDARHDIFSV